MIKLACAAEVELVKKGDVKVTKVNEPTAFS